MTLSLIIFISQAIDCSFKQFVQNTDLFRNEQAGVSMSLTFLVIESFTQAVHSKQ